MAISVNCATRVITIPQGDLTPISTGKYGLDIEDLRIWLKDWEDSEEGIAMPDTHRRNAPVTLSGTTYAQTFEIINGYTILFDYSGSPFTVYVSGGNHNLGDVKVSNAISLVINNSAGLIVTDTGGGGGLTAAQIWTYGTRELTSAPPPSAADNAVAVWLRAIEDGVTAEQLLRVMVAALAGDATGLESETVAFKSIDGTKTRVGGIVVGGNRSITVRDGT